MTNLVSAYLCSRAAVAAFGRAGSGGRIVNVAARQALEPRLGANATAYAAAKAGVAALTIALGEEVAKKDILVNAVAPSIMDTRANRGATATVQRSLSSIRRPFRTTAAHWNPRASGKSRSFRDFHCPVVARSRGSLSNCRRSSRYDSDRPAPDFRDGPLCVVTMICIRAG